MRRVTVCHHRSIREGEPVPQRVRNAQALLDRLRDRDEPAADDPDAEPERAADPDEIPAPADD
jgi:hypothetical protein